MLLLTCCTPPMRDDLGWSCSLAGLVSARQRLGYGGAALSTWLTGYAAAVLGRCCWSTAWANLCMVLVGC